MQDVLYNITEPCVVQRTMCYRRGNNHADQKKERQDLLNVERYTGGNSRVTEYFMQAMNWDNRTWTLIVIKSV